MTKRKRFRDIASVGKSELVPYKHNEDVKRRHMRRLGHALKNKSEVGEWCQERYIQFKVTNSGHHWQFRRENVNCDWWPSSAKFIHNQKFKKGLHVHDFQQLTDRLVEIYGEEVPEQIPEGFQKKMLYILKWGEGLHDDAEEALCGIFSSPEKREEIKQELIKARNKAGNLSFDPNYYEGEWIEEEIELDQSLITEFHIANMGDRRGHTVDN